jgi:hypothetical protein
VPPLPEPDPPLLEVDVAPFGVAPPLLPVGALVPFAVPPALELAPLVPAPEVPAELLPLPVPDDADADGDEPLEDVVEVVFVVDALVVPVETGVVMVCVGTVSAGTPEVSVAAPPPPQAATAAEIAAPAASAANHRVARETAGRSDTIESLRLRAGPSACRNGGSR